jgi:hypothetical protein
MHRKKASQSGAGAPTALAPEFIGQIYYDTTNDDVYTGYGIGTGDWYQLTIDVPGGGGNGLRLITDFTIETATDEVTFTNLDINTHQMYIILVKLINPTSASGYTNMFVNGDFTLANYSSSTGANKANILRVNSNSDTFSTTYLTRFEDDTSSANSLYVRKGRADGQMGWWHDDAITPDTNITSLTFAYQDTTTVFGIDSNISIFGVL